MCGLRHLTLKARQDGMEYCYLSHVHYSSCYVSQTPLVLHLHNTVGYTCTLHAARGGLFEGGGGPVCFHLSKKMTPFDATASPSFVVPRVGILFSYSYQLKCVFLPPGYMLHSRQWLSHCKPSSYS